jgi:hypothetical protein
VSGAISPGEVKKILTDLGFKQIEIIPKEKSKEIVKGWNIGEAANVVFSAYIRAEKPI